MKFKVIKPTTVNIKYLDVYFGGRVFPEDININNTRFDTWEELSQQHPYLFGKRNEESAPEFMLTINVDTGEIENWPIGLSGDFNDVKVVDEGIYVLRDEHLEELTTYINEYVPHCLQINSNGYGDYFEFDVDTNGKIFNWKFTQEDVNQLFRQKCD